MLVTSQLKSIICSGALELWNILSWKGPIRITEFNSYKFRYKFYGGFTESRCGQVENVDLQRNPMLCPLLWNHSAADESVTNSCVERNAQFLTCCLHLGGTGNPSHGCCHQLICTVIALVGSSWLLTDFSQFTWLKIGCGFKHIELKNNITEYFLLYMYKSFENRTSCNNIEILFSDQCELTLLYVADRFVLHL